MSEQQHQPDIPATLRTAETWAPIFKLLGDATRLKLLSAIHFSGQYVLSVGELAEATGLQVATASASLRAMEAHRVVKAQRDGRTIRYGICDDNVHELMHWVGLGHKH